jgi:iron complex transport system substrate-binding protein
VTRTDLANFGALAAALALSVAAAAAAGSSAHTRATEEANASLTVSAGAARIDRGGVRVTPAPFARIASVSSVADDLLLELCEPDRVVAVTGYSARRSFRFHGKTAVEGASDLEKLIALRPDLVIANAVGDPRPLARLRDAGLIVFDLGAMRGLETLIPNIRDVAALVGHPERGERLIQSFVASMRGVAGDVAPSARKRGLYVSVYGGHLFGGSVGSSYGDVLVAAGLTDAAAPRYRDWPEYSIEQLLVLDPDVIVTNTGMRERICEHAGLERLRACAGTQGVVAVDDDLLGDPGLAMLEASQTLRSAVYGPPRGTP